MVAAFEAPERRNEIAAGITPQEHNGNGAPNKAAFNVLLKPGAPSCFCIHAIGTNSFNKPAIIKPNNNHGAELKNSSIKLLNNINDFLICQSMAYGFHDVRYRYLILTPLK